MGSRQLSNKLVIIWDNKQQRYLSVCTLKQCEGFELIIFDGTLRFFPLFELSRNYIVMPLIVRICILFSKYLASFDEA